MPRGRRGHTVSHYRTGKSGTNAFGEQLRTWTELRAGVACDIQLSGGDVMQREYGRVDSSEHPFFADLDALEDLRPDDGIKVTASTLTPQIVGRRFRVKSVLPYSSRGGWQAVLTDTAESF